MNKPTRKHVSRRAKRATLDNLKKSRGAAASPVSPRREANLGVSGPGCPQGLVGGPPTKHTETHPFEAAP
ncbi:hypothetical protein T484DRAFT_2273026 [Baffinella frigidus]|nr:hypothetical protein T484DRAFT_2273026 [Cryptophyta sp. CCMP2293]